MHRNHRISSKTLLFTVFAFFFSTNLLQAQTIDAPDEDWVQMFNGVDLEGWEFKMQGLEIGEDPLNTFHVTDGILHVDYTNYTGFPYFGHIWYTVREYSHYVIRALHNFVGDQAPGGPGWAKQNNGLMLHAQSIESMGMNQDFPNSIEVQLLGTENNQNDGITANLCTPGTHVHMDGNLHTPHCTTADPKSQVDLEWVRVEVLVLGDSLFQHIVEGDTTLEYTEPVLDDMTPLTSGFITLQAESAPFQFQTIEILNLEGCMDPTAGNYKDYLVKHNEDDCVAGVSGCMDEAYEEFDPLATIPDEAACVTLSTGEHKAFRQIFINSSDLTVKIPLEGDHKVEIYSIAGKSVFKQENRGPMEYNLEGRMDQGIHFIEVEWKGHNTIKKVFNQ